MKSLKILALSLAAAWSALLFDPFLGKIAAQRRKTAPPAKQPATPPPAQPSIPIYESSASSGANASAPKQQRAGQAAARQLSPLDQLRVGDFMLQTLDGQVVRIAEVLPEGKPVLIQFWQTSCEQSQAEIKHLNEIWAHYQQQGLVMLALTIDDPAQRRHVSSFVRSARINYPVYFTSANLYHFMAGGYLGTPQTYVFSRAGRIASRMIGWEPKRGRAALEQAVSSTF